MSRMGLPADLAEQQNQVEDLRTAVRIDGLTQLVNRVYFDEKLNETVGKSSKVRGALTRLIPLIF